GASVTNLTLSNPNIHGEDYTGALIGLIIGPDTVTNCHVIGGSVIGNDGVGGLVGYAVDAGPITFYNCHTTCTVTSDAVAGAGNYVGGLIGYANGIDADNCYATGVVTGTGEEVGGLFGNFFTGTADMCYATGAVITGNNGGDSFCGGFVGWSNGDATNCYARGSVTTTGDWVGGFAGSSGQETYCYSTGFVTGVGANVNGFCGVDDTVVACHWDTETSGQAADPAATGQTTSEMKTESTFTGWTFSTIWLITRGCNAGYPCLVQVTPKCEIIRDSLYPKEMVTLEAIRNVEMSARGRFYVDEDGNAKYESRYARN
ncbi:MAG: hypothetical protein KKD44_29395, partial [Proteobacteria bacterium]|nr:hypothetical protein [Pseudomonadota bacterium]